MEDLPEEQSMLGEEAGKDSTHSSPAHYHIAPPPPVDLLGGADGEPVGGGASPGPAPARSSWFTC